MKRLTLAALIAAAALFGAYGSDRGSFFGSLSIGPKTGAMFYSGVTGISTGIGLLAEFDRPAGSFVPYVNGNILYGFTDAFEHSEQDFYATIGGGLSIEPFASLASGVKGGNASGRIPLAFSFGVDVGGGYTKDVYATGRTAGIGGFLIEPKVGIEYRIGAVVLRLSPAYSCIFTPMTTKQTLVVSLGARYIVKGAVK